MSLTINSSGYNYLSGLFSANKSNYSTIGLEANLLDYSLIKSGAYGKLVNTYYSKIASDDSESSTSDVKKNTSNLNEIKRDSEDLSQAANKLLNNGKNSIWEKKDVEKEDGTTVKEYDKDAIYNAIKDFADKYNQLVDSGQKADSTGILTQVAGMVTGSSSTINTLAKAGISIDKDNHLSVDEDFLKNNADMTVVKDLFNGVGSFAYQVGAKASMTNSYANTELSDITGSKSYNNKGSYKLSASDIVSSFDTSS
ncbi:MAG: hypothetical protein K5773_00665 [Pseudobutyrivibrio sp.]|nr:hypothetical protein [Pseudobutyrivibrio sp.]